MAKIDRRDFLVGAGMVLWAAQSSSARSGTPTSAFGAASTAEDVTKGLDLRGKTVVVTGCNSGIGLETMRVLALRGAHVIGTARTREKGEQACASIVGRTTAFVLELTDFDSVVECSREIHALRTPIDMLILNAGIVLDRHEQVYGLEKQFVVNHLGHFILANRLIELSRRLEGSQATSNCVTPGPVKTGILRYTNSSTDHQTKSPAQGAATQCYVATHPSLANVSGDYFKDCNPAPQSEHQTNPEMASKLWSVSTALTKKYLV